jgi:lipoic acid synthetase
VTSAGRVLRIRWLGRTSYDDAHALQQGLLVTGTDDWLLLCEHPHVYTLGRRTDPANLLAGVEASGAAVRNVDRGGDVTYHGPGQLVGYPIRTLPTRNGVPAGEGGITDTRAWVAEVEQLLIDALGRLGVTNAGRLEGCPGVWIDPDGAVPRKVAAIGVRISRGRTMHGFALNVDPDLDMFTNIVPCGIANRPVTSLAAEGIEVELRDVVDAIADLAAQRWSPPGGSERAEVVWRHTPADLSAFSRGEGPGAPVPPDAHGRPERAALSDTAGQPDPAAPAAVSVTMGTTRRRQSRLDEAGVVDAVGLTERKPEWLRAPVRMGDDYRHLRQRLRDRRLVTVCEEAGCPNIYECWGEGTATFMINGERCTRACGFCLVDTRLPVAPDPDEPARVAEAVEEMGLGFAVVTAVARDDLPDGGAAGFAATIGAIRQRTPHVSVEVLIPDVKGEPEALSAIFDAGPDVLNHNIETVARLQRAVRPSAGYGRSLAVLARAKAAGLTTKSGIIVGLGERDDEVVATLADLAGVGVDIVTIGQYLRPTSHHLPVARWVTPEQFAAFAAAGSALGIGHVESSPLTRSSYHARQAADRVTVPDGVPVPDAADPSDSTSAGVAVGPSSGA